MSKKYPCPAGREDDCGYPACAHDRQCELAASPCSGRFMKLNDFCELLASKGVVDECAVHDSEGYDGGSTLNKICAAFYEIDQRLSQNEERTAPANDPEDNNTASAGCMARFVRHALQQVLDYRHGKGKFNLSHLNSYERDNAAHDLWQEVEDDIRQAIKIIETNEGNDAARSH